ncbi:MAG: ketoacyl-ACP synthase III [Spirochaetes bacterium]|nr:ketoacyl-ACP synthase III [Spirochaetota bacterium]
MVKILSIGKYLPEKVMTNEDFEKIMDTSDQWITERTGIKKRYFASEGQAASDLAIPAIEEAVKKGGISLNEIEALIVTTVTPDYFFPSTGCVILKKLGIKDMPAYDILAGCTGFIYGLDIAKNMIQSGNYKAVMVVSVEVLSKIMDFKDRNTAVLFGDGATATILIKSDDNDGIISSVILADGENYEDLIMPAGGSVKPASYETIENREHFIKMNGKAIFKRAVNYMIIATEKALQKAGLNKSDIDLYIPHQANKRIIEAVANFFEVDVNKVFITVDKYANISSATIPIALYDAIEQKAIKKGDKVLLTAFGAGFTYGASIIKF